jgi:hypothetical protein
VRKQLDSQIVQGLPTVKFLRSSTKLVSQH